MGKALIFLHVKTIVKELHATATIIVVTAAAKMINVKIVLHGPTGGPTDDTPLLSETVIIIIAVSAMVFVVSIIVASLCCCRSRKTNIVVGQWNTLQNYADMPENEPKAFM